MPQRLSLEKRADTVLLYDFYGALLTDKQQRALQLFYEEDFSLAEIAAQGGYSRQAAHDLIRRTEALLHDYESKLHLVAQHRKRQHLLAQAKQYLQKQAGLNDEALWHIWRQLEEQ